MKQYNVTYTINLKDVEAESEQEAKEKGEISLMNNGA